TFYIFSYLRAAKKKNIRKPRIAGKYFPHPAFFSLHEKGAPSVNVNLTGKRLLQIICKPSPVILQVFKILLRAFLPVHSHRKQQPFVYSVSSGNPPVFINGKPVALLKVFRLRILHNIPAEVPHKIPGSASIL